MECLVALIIKKNIKNFFESGSWKIERDIKTVDEYEGEIKEGKWHGLGKIIRKNGDIVYGQFKDNKLNGQGLNSFANGDEYVGEF